MKSPPQWTEAELTVEASKSRQLFIDERLKEPLERWISTFAKGLIYKVTLSCLGQPDRRCSSICDGPYRPDIRASL